MHDNELIVNALTINNMNNEFIHYDKSLAVMEVSDINECVYPF